MVGLVRKSRLQFVQGGRLALSPSRFLACCFPVVKAFFVHVNVVFSRIVAWTREEGPKIENVHVYFGPFWWKVPPLKNVWQNNSFVHMAHRRTSLTRDTNPCTTASCVLSDVFTRILRARWYAPRRNCTPSSRWQPLEWATRRSRPRWACRSQRRRGDRAAQRHSAKTCHQVIWHSRHTDIDADSTTNSVNTSRPKMGPPWSVSGPRGSFQFPKNLRTGPFFFECSASGRKKSLKMKGSSL